MVLLFSVSGEVLYIHFVYEIYYYKVTSVKWLVWSDWYELTLIWTGSGIKWLRYEVVGLNCLWIIGYGMKCLGWSDFSMKCPGIEWTVWSDLFPFGMKWLKNEVMIGWRDWEPYFTYQNDNRNNIYALSDFENETPTYMASTQAILNSEWCFQNQILMVLDLNFYIPRIGVIHWITSIFKYM